MFNILITGGSSGLGRALVLAFAGRGHRITTDARHGAALSELAESAAAAPGSVTTVVGDVTDPEHRAALVAAAAAHGAIDVVINNASELGGSPQPALRDLDSEVFARLWRTNVDAPLQLLRSARPRLAGTASILNISSDAAVEHYPGWGGYAATKAALDHLTLTSAEEEPDVRWYAVDPGDMRTPMHQAAFPGEDISDRPTPETVAPRLVALIEARPPSGRYRADEFASAVLPTEMATELPTELGTEVPA